MLTARLASKRDNAVRVTEVRILDEYDPAERLTDMRVGSVSIITNHRPILYFFLNPGMKIRVSFKIDDEAEEFAEKFDGRLLDIPSAADQLLTVWLYANGRSVRTWWNGSFESTASARTQCKRPFEPPIRPLFDPDQIGRGIVHALQSAAEDRRLRSRSSRPAAAHRCHRRQFH